MPASQFQIASDGCRRSLGAIGCGETQHDATNSWPETHGEQCCLRINISNWEFDRIHREIARLRSEGWELDEDGCSETDRDVDEAGGALTLKLIRFSAMPTDC